MSLNPIRIVTALALASISGMLCVLLEVIGAFGLSFGGDMGPWGPFGDLLWSCYFLFRSHSALSL
jgi:hypothetical protein